MGRKMRKNDKNKDRYLSKGDYLLKNKERILRKKRKKKRQMRVFMVLSILVIVGIYFVLKHEMFNIKMVKVGNNRVVSNEDISNLSGIKIGENIFMIRDKEIVKKVKRNGYIEQVKIERKLPDTVIIKVTEREAEYYQEENGDFFILDKNGIFLEKLKNIEGLNFFPVIGMDLVGAQIGEKIKDSDIRKFDFLLEFSELRKVNSSGYEFSKVDLSSMVSITTQVENIEIKLGKSDELKEKLEKAMNIYIENELQGKRGYIDVSSIEKLTYFTEKDETDEIIEDKEVESE